MVKTPKYLLDSDILITMLRDRGDRSGLRRKALNVGLDNCFVSGISLAELYYGAYRSMSDRGFHELEYVKKIFTVLPFSGVDADDCAIYGETRSLLEAAGTPLDDMDLLIASSAIQNGLTLVTHNIRHFSRIPTLQVEDWINP